MSFWDTQVETLNQPPKIAKGSKSGAARGYLNKLLGTDFAYPKRDIAGMTDIEQEGQSILENLAKGGGFQDPQTGQYWQGLRREMDREEEEGASALSHRFRNLMSSPAMGEMADYRADMANKKMTVLGQLYEQERQRDNPYTRLAAVNQYGSLPRQLEQQEFDAQYAQHLQDLLAPFNLYTPLAQQMIGNEMWYNQTNITSPSMAGQVGSLMSSTGDLIGGIASAAG